MIYLLFGIFESILSEHLVFDVFKLIGNFIQLRIGEVLFPGGKDNCVLAGCVVRIHQHEAVNIPMPAFPMSHRNPGTVGDGQNIIGYFAAAIVLLGKDVGIPLQFAALFSYEWEYMLFFEHAFS